MVIYTFTDTSQERRYYSSKMILKGQSRHFTAAMTEASEILMRVRIDIGLTDILKSSRFMNVVQCVTCYDFILIDLNRIR